MITLDEFNMKLHVLLSELGESGHRTDSIAISWDNFSSVSDEFYVPREIEFNIRSKK